MKRSIDAAAVRDLAGACKLLGDGSRMKIVSRLACQEQNVTELCRKLKVNQPTMSHHLGLLRMGRVVLSRREGKRVIYGLNKELLGALARHLGAVAGGKK